MVKLTEAPPTAETPAKPASPARNVTFRPSRSGEPAAEQQQAAEGEGVGVDDPGQAGVAEAEVGLDVRQRDVDDGAVEHDHQLRAADDG